jgi:hypothetical protein
VAFDHPGNDAYGLAYLRDGAQAQQQRSLSQSCYSDPEYHIIKPADLSTGFVIDLKSFLIFRTALIS